MTDSEFLEKLLSDFFSREHIKESLNDIQKFNITGWETWLQIELFIFLRKLEGSTLAEVKRESWLDFNFSTAVARNSGYSRNFIDFMIRRKYLKSKGKWIPLEIKISKSLKSCLNKMVIDENKYNAVKKTVKRKELLRFPFFLGIYINYTSERKQASVNNILEAYGLKGHQPFLIPDTNFSWILYYLK